MPKKKKYSLMNILMATRKDKKAVSGKVYYSLPSRIGKMSSVKGNFGIKVRDSLVLRAMEDSN